MRSTLLILAAAMIVLSCQGKKKVSVPKADKVETPAAAGKTIKMDKAMFVAKVAELKESQSDFKYKGDKPAIIDFYATWCGPCKMVSPIMEQLASQYAGKIYIYKVDVDQEKELAAAFGIESIPSVLFIPMSGKPTMMQGAAPKEEFEKSIKTILLK